MSANRSGLSGTGGRESELGSHHDEQFWAVAIELLCAHYQDVKYNLDVR